MEERFRGEGVAGQHTLTKILAQKWGETSADDKKVCKRAHFHSAIKTLHVDIHALSSTNLEA